MTKNAQRLSQLISTFGPGAMIDLPTRSVVVGGLEQWDMKGNAFTTHPGTAPDDAPGAASQGARSPRSGSKPFVAHAADIGRRQRRNSSRRRRADLSDVVRLRAGGDDHGGGQSDAPSAVGALAGSRYARVGEGSIFDDGRKSDVTPIRFVCACDKGHLQDIDWRWVVHGSVPCQEPMWVEEKGTSADPADTSIVCGCGRRLSLQDTFQPGRLGKCRGERPWLLDRDPDGCDDNLKLLTRTATNTYFPQVLHGHLASERGRRAKPTWSTSYPGIWRAVQTVQDVAQAKRFNPKVSASLGPFSDGEIFDRLQRIRDGRKVDATRSPKLSEFDTFASGRPEIGDNHPTAKLYAQTLPRDVWADPDAGIDLSAIKNLVAVHRLREVSCLYGFTRFEAAPTGADGDIEDIQLSVRGAPISRDADWLPAIEQFGEGIFIHFDEAAIAQWLQRPTTIQRNGKLLAGYRSLAKALRR